MKKIFMILALLLHANLCAQDISGVWKGSLNIGTSTLEMYFMLQNADSRHKATMSVPQQGVTELHMDSTTYINSVLTLVNKDLNMKYVGKYVDGGFRGEFLQHGFKFTVNLTKSEVPKQKRPQEPKPPFHYKEENVVFNNEKHNINLAGTLTIPYDKRTFPAVVLISGSGYQDRNEEIMGHKPFLVIADYLTKNGIAVLRFDDRGVGESQGTTKGNTTEDLSYDTEAAFNYLKTRKDISKIGLCGHSEGGSIAFMIAARNPNVDFVISMAGAILPGYEILLSQQRAIGMANNTPTQTLDLIGGINKRYYDTVLNSEANDQVLRQKILDIVREYSVIQKDKDRIINELTDPWMYYFIRYIPFDDIKKIKVPVLAFNGTKDLQVLPDLNLSKMKEIVKISGNTDVRIEYLEGLNHMFQRSNTGNPREYGVLEETFSIGVLEMMREWILEQ